MLGGSESGVPFVRRGGGDLPGSCDPALASDACLPPRALSRDRRYHRIRLGSRRGRAGTDRQWGGHGFLLHSALMVAAESETVVGLVGQEIHYRKPVPKGETRTQRLARERESDLWGKLIDAQWGRRLRRFSGCMCSIGEPTISRCTAIVWSRR